MVGHYLVDALVLVSFGLSVSDKDDEAWFTHGLICFIKSSMNVELENCVCVGKSVTNKHQLKRRCIHLQRTLVVIADSAFSTSNVLSTTTPTHNTQNPTSRSLEMSEPIPESIPTSHDRKSQRPVKKRALTPSSQQSSQIDALFANPDRSINTDTTTKSRTTLAPPEIVANVQGSSAGAGSGEFHVYKASRRREYERLRVMDAEVEREEKDKQWKEQKEGQQKQDEEKLSKNQAKRAKAKARKEKGELLKKTGAMDLDEEGENDGVGGRGVVKRKLAPAKVAMGPNGDAEVKDAQMNGNGEGVEEGGGVVFHDDD